MSRLEWIAVGAILALVYALGTDSYQKFPDRDAALAAPLWR